MLLEEDERGVQLTQKRQGRGQGSEVDGSARGPRRPISRGIGPVWGAKDAAAGGAVRRTWGSIPGLRAPTSRAKARRDS
eukprot:15443461-Alexandrium_andersonii.AAC.1